MRRILAAFAAIAMIAGGFLVRKALDDPERGKEPLRLWCVPEAAAACRSITSRVEVSVDTPAGFEARLRSMDPQAPALDAMVTDPMWIDRAAAAPTRVRSTTQVASSPLAVVERAGQQACHGDLLCAVHFGSKTSLPPVDDGITGPVAAAAAFTASKIAAADVESNRGQQLARTLRESIQPIANGLAPLQGLTSLKLVDAVVLSEAELAAAAPAGTVSAAVRPSVEIELAVARFTGDGRVTRLIDELRAELLRTGWRASTGSRATPPPDLLNRVYEVMR